MKYTQLLNSLNLYNINENPFKTFIDFDEDGDGQLYIEIPNSINDIFISKISNIKVLGGDGDVIFNKNILNIPNCNNEINIGKNKVFIRIFNIKNYQNVSVQFDITLSLYSSL
jgi:hypothetical protein